MEVDPFEARLEFLSLLAKLNASQHSIQKVGSFAMRNRNLYEDLYSCIIEELEQRFRLHGVAPVSRGWKSHSRDHLAKASSTLNELMG
ncbi:hypothetical protein BGX34_011396 [Mortierella sp. NVP85]|nr:hypothetical protein BGX34_011396 [Mortierella sp. NVP85]